LSTKSVSPSLSAHGDERHGIRIVLKQRYMEIFSLEKDIISKEISSTL
jgi:hypothetical protein